MCLLKVDKKVALAQWLLSLLFVSVRVEKEGEALCQKGFPHRTRSGLPVGETDGPRRGSPRPRSGGSAEALLQVIPILYSQISTPIPE